MRRIAGRKLFWWLGAAAVAGIAVVAAGIPVYNEWQRRAQLSEAFRNLADIQVWMEAYYAHNRSYARAGVCGAAVVPADRARYFAYSCVPDTVAGAPPGQTYAATANGKSRHTEGFVFSIDEKKQRVTRSVPADWGRLPPKATTTWLDRKN